MSEIKLGGSEDHPQTAQTKKEKKEKKDKEKKDKEKKKKRGGSRIERLSRVVKEKVQGNAGGNDSTTDDEAKVDTEEDFSADEALNIDDEAAAGGDGVMEGLSSSAGASPTSARRLTMAQVKDRSLSAQAKRKRSATDGATAASLLGSFRRPGASKLKRRENAPTADGAAAGLEGDEEAAAAVAVEGDEQDEGAGSAKAKKDKKDKQKKGHSSRRKKKEDKSLPLPTASRHSLSVKLNGEDAEGDAEGDGEAEHGGGQREEGGSGDGEAKGNTEKLRKNLTRSGSMVELKKQINHIDRQTLNPRSASRDSVTPAKETPSLERFVSLKNISINLSSVFGDGSARGGSNSDKSPRRVSSTPDSLMQPASARKMNPLWVLNQKAKMVEEEKDKREREERRKREREVLPVGEDVPEKQRQRNRVINEIVNTERDYVQDLKIMLTLFRMPLDEEGILTKEELSTIFSNLSMLLHVNSELYDDISKRVKETNGEELGQCFVLLADYLKMYSQYCSNQAAAREAVVNASKTNPRFRAFQEKMAVNPELNGLTLRDYLIKPVQRLCKYPLLMRELIKHTDEAHVDYPHLQEAFGKIEAVVTSVNEKKQADEDREVIARIISRLSNTEKFGVQLMVPGRRLVQEGKLMEVAKDRSESFRRRFFLFTDLLILAEDKDKPGSSRRKDAMLKVVSMIPFAQASLLDLPDKGDQHHVIDIAYKKDVTTLRFDSVEEKQEWLTSLTGKMQKLQSLSARSASSSSGHFEELASSAVLERVKAPSPPSGPSTFPATSLSP
ncbi:RhoGEF domain containing protein [Acanthamoeba castellanii str. Neff]|uniref:RhoGEF domain containing protein n=1 Tax=Acanthamoeba castellanii (strain ATCC 30010 / Neff) TaxID=1257118 RepID=L8GZK0_ACACF|nr:RhoGEF domain containing protein [Acanthamoeba castellanii str. Neff]ELR18659.1 RhoGEF domain containing protein [Acanthamoeba castellanii str. Neff]